MIDKIQEEVDEIREGALSDERSRRDLEEEVGDLLFAIANLSRKLGIEPESALRKANAKFATRFTAMESAIGGSGRRMPEMTLDELESEWQKAKNVVSAKRSHENTKARNGLSIMAFTRRLASIQEAISAR